MEFPKQENTHGANNWLKMIFVCTQLETEEQRCVLCHRVGCQSSLQRQNRCKQKKRVNSAATFFTVRMPIKTFGQHGYADQVRPLCVELEANRQVGRNRGRACLHVRRCKISSWAIINPDTKEQSYMGKHATRSLDSALAPFRRFFRNIGHWLDVRKESAIPFCLWRRHIQDAW